MLYASSFATAWLEWECEELLRGRSEIRMKFCSTTTDGDGVL